MSRLAQKEGPAWLAYGPLALAVALVLVFARDLLAWQFMWLLAIAIFAGLKWLTWRKVRSRIRHHAWRSFAYLFAWPGMEAETFLDSTIVPPRPRASQWVTAACETGLGAAVFWAVAHRVPPEMPWLRGWLGMLGIILMLHFGSFHLLALFWQRVGVQAKPLMDAPLRATSLAEFWGRRWNIGFRQFAHDLVFQPLHRPLGPRTAAFLVFVLSGIIHDLVISVPARAGYGFPTGYFVLQGVGAQFERSEIGSRVGLRHGFRGWLFTALVAGAPAYLLFHPWFVTRVILPFMEALRAL